MKRLLLLFHTLRYLKPVQILNRVWRKVPSRPCHDAALEPCGGKAAAEFPRFIRVWDGATGFTFLNETHALASAADWNNGDWKKLWLYNLHYFDCLRQEGVTDVKCAELMLRWIAENPAGKGNGWEPYPVSLRVANWIKFLIAAKGISDVQRREIDRSLALQVRWLAKRLEYHLLANHLLANAKALVFAGLYFGGKNREARKWLGKGMAIYRRELPEQVLADGVHFERSAMYHSIILEDVLDCLNMAAGFGADAALFRDFAGRMLGGLDLLTGPDGRIALFNDAAYGIALDPAVLRAYAERLGVAAAQRTAQTAASVQKGSGFVRMAAGTWTLIAKCGEIGPSYQPGHAHADSLTFELWHGAEKVVTDTGTDRYVIDEERKRQRGTAAHNTVVIGEANSSEVWAGHRVGRRAKSRVISLNDRELKAECVDVRGNRHTRTLRLTETGLFGSDEISLACSSVKAEIRFHFTEKSVLGYQLSSGAGIAWEEAQIAEEFGKTVPAQCAVIRVPDAQPAVEWTIRTNA